MITVLLQQIIDMLKEFFQGFIEWSNVIGDKIAGIKDDTADISDSNNVIKYNTDDIKDNTGAIITPVNSIKINSDSIKTDTTTIKNTVGTMSNQLSTISTNVGATTAFSEDTATNTLNTLNKVTTIASDTTQIRHVDTNIYSRLNTIYTKLDWLLYGVDFINEISGASPIVFNTDKPLIPIKKIISNIVAIQDLHGYTKPWSGGAGKNKLDYLNNLRASSSGLTIEGTSSGAIHYSGTATQSYSQLTSPFNLSIPSGTTITVSRDVSLGYQHYFSFTFTDNSVDYVRIMPNTTSTTYTLAKDLKNIDIVCLGLTVGTAYNATVKFQLEYGSQATSWEPYSNICPISGFSDLTVTLADGDMQTVDTKTINFDQTVYGGVADVTNGKVTVTHKVETLVGTENWQVSGSGDSQIFYLTISDMKSGLNLDGISNYIKTFAGSTAELCIRFGYNSNIIFIYAGTTITEVTDLASFKTYLSNNNLQICYPLATPPEITINPISIEQTLGDNIITTNTNGDLNIAYIESVRNHINS